MRFFYKLLFLYYKIDGDKLRDCRLKLIAEM